MGKPSRPLPPLELLKDRFYISEDSPSGLRNKQMLSSRALKDAVAGCKAHTGYYYVGINSVLYLAHRVAYALLTGEDPGEMEVDHEKGKDVDALKLRKATSGQNNCSVRPRKGKKYKGVTLKPNGRWRAVITKDKQDYHLGYFATLKEACDAYDRKALELHGEFAVLNNFVE